ncbi:hypothetical protein NHX12_010256 [Muraenolepis orangiensis]|uniref:Uncharacterized protein n=1 Tax=Muraenolepis orangiensis TaxID=630683 RepID=A0A9Q0DKU0_9TELE|nr:hypothetical protein NHX12_010256 [Muraenolepis orangiensis]
MGSSSLMGWGSLSAGPCRGAEVETVEEVEAGATVEAEVETVEEVEAGATVEAEVEAGMEVNVEVAILVEWVEIEAEVDGSLVGGGG